MQTMQVWRWLAIGVVVLSLGAIPVCLRIDFPEVSTQQVQRYTLFYGCLVAVGYAAVKAESWLGFRIAEKRKAADLQKDVATKD